MKNKIIKSLFVGVLIKSVKKSFYKLNLVKIKNLNFTLSLKRFKHNKVNI